MTYASVDALRPSWVSRTGYTRYALVSSRDLIGAVPSGDEVCRPYSQEAATQSDRPYLSITTVPGPCERGVLSGGRLSGRAGIRSGGQL